MSRLNLVFSILWAKKKNFENNEFFSTIYEINKRLTVTKL